MSLVDQVRQRAAAKAHTVRILSQTGVLAPMRPDRVARVGRELLRWGPTPAGGYAASAARRPDRTAIVDERGALTFAEVHRRTNALANALNDEGIGEGDAVAVMCRNHRSFVDATVALSKLGATTLYLNTAFAGPQIAEVCATEAPRAIIHDAEFGPLLQGTGPATRRYVAWDDDPREAADADGRLEDLIAAGRQDDLRPPSQRSRVVILTSGTTGAPKGANRHQPRSLDPAAALFSKIPLRSDEPTFVAAPLFHTWGLAHFTLGMALGSTLVLRRRFEPEETLAAVAAQRCTALILVPVMLQRLLELSPEALARHDLSALRIVATSGSALPGDLATRVLERFGDVLYNLYGSTEVAWATIATPEDLRAAPGTAGRPPRGTIVRLLDEAGRDVAPGETGRIFVGNEMLFDGYTGGSNKQMVSGLMSSGDVGHLDEAGRLFIDGRDDEMIISGGENVFPREVEDLLAAHPAVEEVAVIGVPDDRFGHRLLAFVVVVEGAPPDAGTLRDHVRDNLASFKVPRDVVFLDELPRNATGKILKRVLAERDDAS